MKLTTIIAALRERCPRFENRVQGWRQGSGALWRPGLSVIVFDPLNNFDNDELVIAEVTYNQDDRGTTTELRVGPADAYLPEPVTARKKKNVEEDF